VNIQKLVWGRTGGMPELARPGIAITAAREGGLLLVSGVCRAPGSAVSAGIPGSELDLARGILVVAVSTPNQHSEAVNLSRAGGTLLFDGDVEPIESDFIVGFRFLVDLASLYATPHLFHVAYREYVSSIEWIRG